MQICLAYNEEKRKMILEESCLTRMVPSSLVASLIARVD